MILQCRPKVRTAFALKHKIAPFSTTPPVSPAPPVKPAEPIVPQNPVVPKQSSFFSRMFLELGDVITGKNYYIVNNHIIHIVTPIIQ